MYLKRKKPQIKVIVNTKDNILVYLSIELVIDLPNISNRVANRKNLALLLIELANINIKKFKLKIVFFIMRTQ